MKRDLYFKELALVLGRAGFTLRPQENDFLPVEYHSQRLCRVNDQGNVFYRQEEVDSPEREQARVKVTDMAGTVLEYMSHLEHAPVLQAIGLSEPYQSLAEFNGTASSEITSTEASAEAQRKHRHRADGTTGLGSAQWINRPPRADHGASFRREDIFHSSASAGAGDDLGAAAY